jgi:hypothetical protein
MKMRQIVLAALVSLAFSGLARAGELVGKWKTEFDSPIGPQQYAYEFKREGDKLTGQAKFSHSLGKGENTIFDIKVEGDAVTFHETLNIEGMEIPVSYAGKFVGDEVHLKRTVGEFGVENLVLKRVTDTKDQEAM